MCSLLDFSSAIFSSFFLYVSLSLVDASQEDIVESITFQYFAGRKRPVSTVIVVSLASLLCTPEDESLKSFCMLLYGSFGSLIKFSLYQCVTVPAVNLKALILTYVLYNH